jgi:hypothetical protein
MHSLVLAVSNSQIALSTVIGFVSGNAVDGRHYTSLASQVPLFKVSLEGLAGILAQYKGRYSTVVGIQVGPPAYHPCLLTSFTHSHVLLACHCHLTISLLCMHRYLVDAWLHVLPPPVHLQPTGWTMERQTGRSSCGSRLKKGNVIIHKVQGGPQLQRAWLPASGPCPGLMCNCHALQTWLHQSLTWFAYPQHAPDLPDSYTPAPSRPQ